HPKHRSDLRICYRGAQALEHRVRRGTFRGFFAPPADFFQISALAPTVRLHAARHTSRPQPSSEAVGFFILHKGGSGMEKRRHEKERRAPWCFPQPPRPSS
ncbi:MAG: hypothetical protein FWB81_01690, partial [Cystobacterineae bacterium]|nr:hypothetical protein [Cystobacterineae bacterium]